MLASRGAAAMKADGFPRVKTMKLARAHARRDFRNEPVMIRILLLPGTNKSVRSALVYALSGGVVKPV
jgi:hypothetical protein